MIAPHQATGQIRYRSTWRGKLVLQVEMKGDEMSNAPPANCEAVIYWRDARTSDLAPTLMEMAK